MLEPTLLVLGQLHIQEPIVRPNRLVASVPVQLEVRLMPESTGPAVVLDLAVVLAMERVQLEFQLQQAEEPIPGAQVLVPIPVALEVQLVRVLASESLLLAQSCRPSSFQH